MNPQPIDLDQSRILVNNAHKYPTRLGRQLQFRLGLNSEMIAQALGNDDSPGFVYLHSRAILLWHLPLPYGISEVDTIDIPSGPQPNRSRSVHLDADYLIRSLTA